MSAMDPKEIFNFVNKFLNLRENGENATLTLKCQDGKVAINLQLHMSLCAPPPCYKPHPPHRPRPCSRPSPSRVRRSARRAAARAESAEKADADIVLPTSKTDTTEQVAIGSATTKTTDVSDANNEAEQAITSINKVSHHHHQPLAEEATPGWVSEAPQDVHHAIMGTLVTEDVDQPRSEETVTTKDVANLIKSISDKLTADLATSWGRAVPSRNDNKDNLQIPRLPPE